jgi:predicted amidohydrolase YtcJ
MTSNRRATCGMVGRMSLLNRRTLAAAAGAGLAVAASTSRAGTSAAPPEPADLVLRNGHIVTMDPARPRAEALAARGETIVAVGSWPEIAPYVGSRTHTIDLGGRLAVPGLIEGHGHFTGIGETRLGLDLTPARSWDEIVALVAEAAAAAPQGEWILGRGWHQEKWASAPAPAVEGFPVHASLSRVSPRNPVMLEHASGHATFVNARAMELGGITRETPPPPGGQILRDSAGEPTGLLRETASAPVERALADERARRTPAQVEADFRRVVDLATRECLSKGITSFQDAGSSFETIDALKRLADVGALGLRLWVMVRDDPAALAEKLPRYRMVAAGAARLTVRAIKHSLDGALGSRGAWLLEPYADLPASAGLETTPLPVIEQTARLALRHGYQLCVHAIGDRANRETLDLYERAFGARGGGRELRWRIEHAQHLHPADIPRFGALGVIAAMQGVHATSDGPWVPRRLGERRTAEGAYVWQKLLRSGAVIANGTDAPVEDVDPVASFYASVSRRLPDGSIFQTDQRMSREQALRSYTIDAAYAAFEEDSKGSLAPGKLADVTVLSRDIMDVPEAEIPGTEVVYTILGGKVAYEKEPGATRSIRP